MSEPSEVVKERANDSGHRTRPSRWLNASDVLSEQSDLLEDETDLLPDESDLLSEEIDLVSIDFVPRAAVGVPLATEA